MIVLVDCGEHDQIAGATLDGEAEMVGSEKEFRIVNAPPPEPRQVEREGWRVLRLSTGEMGVPCDSKEDAEDLAALDSGTVAARITWTEPAPEPEKPAERWAVFSSAGRGHLSIEDYELRSRDEADRSAARITGRKHRPDQVYVARLEPVDPARAPGDGDGGA